ncbi:hypothetical protein ACFPJ1_43190 [Kribbella qitaiheensis]|uniref:hypothetical protein n=1 Tax=Kribbella qitaiheensis TaxID=1544730 RepID=UPI003610F3E1
MAVQDERLLSVEFVCDIWLGVLDDPPAYNEIRAFWNVKENRVLEYLPHGHRWWLGSTNAGDYPSPGRAGAVFDLLFLLGTTPDYNAPAITRELIDRLLAAFASAPESTLPAAPIDSLREFLERHEGRYLVCD